MTRAAEFLLIQPRTWNDLIHLREFLVKGLWAACGFFVDNQVIKVEVEELEELEQLGSTETETVQVMRLAVHFYLDEKCEVASVCAMIL